MYGNMLTDRTALDGLVYSAYLFKNNKIDASTLRYVKDVFNKVWHSYDYVFYIEPEFEIVDDGVRSINKQFRDEIADLFEATIEKEKLNIQIVDGSIKFINLVEDISTSKIIKKIGGNLIEKVFG
jgi:hypothetical protein